MPHYHITIKPTKSESFTTIVRIVEAKNAARAVAHVIGDTVFVKLAEPADFMALAKADGEIETAKEE